MKIITRFLLGVFACACLNSLVGAVEPITFGESDWPWWRGPTRNGKAVNTAHSPATWSSSANVLWRTAVPGRGHGSPTVVGDHIFLATSNVEKGTQSVHAFDTNTGDVLWTRIVNTGGLPRTIHRKNTHASSTVACDGVRAFITFYNHDAIQIAALRISDGAIVWTKQVGPFKPRAYEFGYGSSPALSGDLVLAAADYEKGGFLVALNRGDGRTVWRTPRPSGLVSFGSPVVTTVDGQEQILLGGCKLVACYSLKTGKMLWSADASAQAVCGTPVWDNGLVFTSGGHPESMTTAVRMDGSGTVVWRNNDRSYEQSLLAHAGSVYALNDTGIVRCWRAMDGKELWSQRFKGPVSASPVLVDDRIYVTNERGSTLVFKASATGFEKIAENQLGNVSMATPTFCGNRVYTRVGDRKGSTVQEWLYCLGKE